ncbi:MAG TPA: tetratricopeptide repeat protein [Bacteroidia bacterium]|nr:tetratricopeptide repeat protein [Bacteroidia bacterium]
MKLIKKIEWKYVAFQILFVGILCLLFYLLNIKHPVLSGTLLYIVLSLVVRAFVLDDFRKGIQAVKKGQYKEAITYFENIYNYLNKNGWLDKYRFITLLTVSKIPVREMALLNIASCCKELGNNFKAKEYYNRVLTEFPGSIMAQTALNMLNSFNDKTD